jgi:hypothetical protein
MNFFVLRMFSEYVMRQVCLFLIRGKGRIVSGNISHIADFVLSRSTCVFKYPTFRGLSVIVGLNRFSYSEL